MKRYVFFGSIIFVLLVFPCCKKKIQGGEKVFTMNQITDNYDSLINRVKIKGDTNAYDELFYGFMDSNKSERTDSVLRYSRIMAGNFN